MARTRSEIEAAAAAIQARGGRAEPLRLDVADPETVRETLGAHDRFDILVNKAGTDHPDPFTEVSVAGFDAIIGLNLRAAFSVAQTVARRMIESAREGSIIHVSSQMGHVGGANRSVFCASKHALEGLTKAMAIGLAPARIRVNTIAPTYIETPLTQPYFQDPAFRDDVLARIKLGRIGQVEDLMGAIVFLASDASKLMTGSSVVIDGGWTAE